MNPTPPQARQYYALLWIIGSLVTAAVVLACVCVGPGEGAIRFGWPTAEVLPYRLYPLLSAALVGAALAAAGVVLQALLKNPLADPYILGLSSGAGVGAVAFIIYGNYFLFSVLGSGVMLGTSGFAMLGAIATCVIVFALARRPGFLGGIDAITLVLVGVVINAFNAAVIEVLVATAPRTQARLDVMSYLMGNIDDGVDRWRLIVAAGLLAIGWAMAVVLAGAMNIASVSDHEAASLGVKLSRLRTWSFIASSVLTATAISLAGPIGFVGLICPHVCRALVGADHRRLVIAAPLLGACFLSIAFTLVHSTGFLFNGDLPIGVITALCGGPFFLMILRRRGAWMNE